MEEFISNLFLKEEHIVGYTFVLGLMYSFIIDFHSDLTKNREEQNKAENLVLNFGQHKSPMIDVLLGSYKVDLAKSNRRISNREKLLKAYMWVYAFLIVCLGLYLFQGLKLNSYFVLTINLTILACLTLLVILIYLLWIKKEDPKYMPPLIIEKLKKSPFYESPF